MTSTIAKKPAHIHQVPIVSMKISSVSKRPSFVDDDGSAFDRQTFAIAAKVWLAACLHRAPGAPGNHRDFRIDDATAKSYSPLD
jgi:hypothetical protein